MFDFISNIFFKNSGKRLQKVAVAFFIIQAITAIVGGIFMFVTGLVEFDMYGLCFAAPFATLAAIGVACIDSLFLYGFGELIENTSYLRPNETKTQKAKASHTVSSNKDNNAGKDTSTKIKNSINPAPKSKKSKNQNPEPKTVLYHCAECGKLSPDKLCIDCKNRMIDNENNLSDFSPCPVCGADISNDGAFCHVCNAKLEQ